MSASTRYSDYTVTIGEDYKTDCYYTEFVNDPSLTIRVFYTVTRIPSRKEFVIKFLRNVTPDERALITKKLLPRAAYFFSKWERTMRGGIARERVPGSTAWQYRVAMGKAVSDPLVQLELEMMIDLTREVSTT
ncbi:hypothetical protein [Microbacterium dauci]|uniref:Uncharacterized protein n=1 Tax=Microbacterium dauci TaxID=3048008 RepID=A0ABT6ZIF2_9MICO|nr:hypothetical protein [Microbacterium sp. LX3-4]MDJ1115397.1 hypothetical protein [Microbacterium sp. LX3-4]